MPPFGGNPKPPKRKRPAPKPPSPAGDRPQTHGASKPHAPSKPPSPAGDRPQTHGPTGAAKPASPAGDRAGTRSDGRRRAPRYVVPRSPAGDRPQTHGPTGTVKPPSPAGDRPQTHSGDRAFKKSKTYRDTLRAAYEAQDLAARRLIAAKLLANRLENKDAKAAYRSHEGRHQEDVDQLFNEGGLRRLGDRTDDELGFSSVPKHKGDAPLKVTPGLESYRHRDEPEAHRVERAAKEAAHAKAHPYEKPSKLAVAVGGAIPGLVRSAGALVEGTYRDPIGVPTKTAKQGALALAALPAGVAASVAHPVKTASAAVDDYATRNDETYDEKLARVRKEGGFAELADLTTALSFGGGAAAKTALIAKAPERAAKLLSGGVAKAPRKGGPARYAVGRAVDARKAAKYEKIAARAERSKGPGLTALQNEALKANRAAGRVVAVVPSRSGRKIAGVVGQARGKAVAGLKFDTARGPFAKLAREKFNLNKDEAQALWLGTEVGVRDAATARTVGKALRDKMAAGRDADPAGWERAMDVVAQIDKILENPEKHFTPKFAATMDRIHEYAQQISHEEPQFKEGTKENRRRAVQRWLLDLEQGVTPAEAPKPEVLYHASRNGLAKSGHETASFEVHLGTREAAEDRVKAFNGGDHKIEEFSLPADAKLPNDGEPGSKSNPFTEADLGTLPPAKLASAGVSVYRYPQAVRELREKGYDAVYYRNEIEDPGSLSVLALDRRRLAGNAPEPAPLRYEPESDADFNARIDAAAKKAGLAAPTYFRSEKQQGLQADFASRAVGGGGPKSTGKQYGGKNLEQGIFDTSWDQFIRGYAHNIKATHNYPLVAALDDKNRLRSFSPDDQPQGKELGALMNDVNRSEPLVKKGSVVFVNKGLFEKAVLDDSSSPDAHATPEDAANAQAETALQSAVVREGDPRLSDPEYLKTPGWVAWPVEAERELAAELSAGTRGGRALDIAKGTASKAILLTTNFPWFALQAVSETAVTGIASKGLALTPRNIVGTKRWWDAMNHTQRRHVATELGLGATGSDTQSIKMGATTNGNLFNAWRDLKAADFWHRPRVGNAPVAKIINPVQWMRAADQGKTNVTRLLYAHSELTKKISPEGTDSLAGALTNMAAFGKNADRLLPVFKKPSADQLKYLQENPKLLEEMGETVSNALGDWTSMTARERKLANRAVMFYPFMRYSTRLILHTLPVDHPAVTGLLAELGQLTAEEYREVFGDDDLPWNIGKVYFGKTGESEYIDLSRANPAGNAVVSGLARLGTSSSNAPGAAVGVLPPYAQWLIDDLTGINTFKGKVQRIEGDTSPIWNPAWKRDNAPELMGKLAVAQFQSLFYPAREAMGRLHPESQSDESSLLFPTPMKYKPSKEIEGNSEDANIRRRDAQAAETQQRFNAENNGGIADLIVGPLAPRASRDKAAADERAYIKKLKEKQAAGEAERKAYRDSHGGKNKPKPPKPKTFHAGGARRNFNKGGGG